MACDKESGVATLGPNPWRAVGALSGGGGGKMAGWGGLKKVWGDSRGGWTRWNRVSSSLVEEGEGQASEASEAC